MIIQKIEKYSQISFSQDNCGERKAALQSCYFNLKNLKAIVQKNMESIHHGQDTKNVGRSPPTHRVSQNNLTLPEISVTNIRNKQNFTNSIQLKQIGSRNSGKYLNADSTSLFDLTNKFNINATNSTDVSKKYNLQGSSICKLSPQKEKRKNKKNLNFRTRKEKVLLGLPKNQKYYEQTQIKVSQQVVEKLGLYEAANLYKKNTIQRFLKQGYESKFQPVINLKFATFSLCNRNEFFLTDGSFLPDVNEADSKPESSKKIEMKRSEKKVIQLQKREQSSNDSIMENPVLEILESKVESSYKNIDWLLTIQNYEVVKNEQYFGFKKNNIDDWNELKFILHMICLYLKKVKISLLSFKFEKSIFMKELWSSQRINDGALERLLKIKLAVKDQEKQNLKTIKLFNSRAEVIKYLVQMWKDRQSLLNMKKIKQKERQRLVWSAIRITAKHKMRIAKRKRAARAQVLNEKLKSGEWDYEIQIHIPSFSESEFVRNTTQYMEHYENMFYHMWKSSTKQFVLIIPAINETILQLFQNKIKLSKNITLICPESHELYPQSLPLSATLLYSRDALHKIKRVLQGKRGIIIPGRQISNKFLYEQHLSDLLNCPLFSTLNLSTCPGDIKNIWLKHGIPTATFTVIEPKSTIELVIEELTQLIYENQKTKVWVFKINNEFNGRGIAIFDANSSVKLKQILSFSEKNEGSDKQIGQDHRPNLRRKNQIKSLIISYLEVHFRLKLKINFENCIFRVEEFIQMFLQKGGIIEQYIEDCETYQFCYKLDPGYSNYSHLYILDQIEEEKYISCTQNYEVDFVTKSSLFVNETIPKIMKDFSRRAQKLLKEQRYLGYVSVTVLYSTKRQQYFAIEIKPYMTLNSSMSFLLKVFTNKKPLNLTNRRNGNLVSHSNIQSSEANCIENSNGSKLLFLFIPYIIFTDVDQEVRSQIIENLVVDSWDKISNKLFSQLIVSENPDTFHGTLYLSLGLTLGILIYGKPHDLRKMKNRAIECTRELSEKIESIKLYRGKQEQRDVFQFGDLIRAITKIKP